jgi:hypothetical protein
LPQALHSKQTASALPRDRRATFGAVAEWGHATKLIEVDPLFVNAPITAADR